MSPLLVLIATAALGIEVGWEPLADGGHEYMIQLEPELVDLLKRGTDEITSEVPPQINVRRYRIFVGSGKLARIDGQRQPAAEPAAPHLPPAEAPHKPELSPPAETDLNSADSLRSGENQRRTAAHPEDTIPSAASAVPAAQAGAQEMPGPLSDGLKRAKPLASASFNAPPAADHAKKHEPQSNHDRASVPEEAKPWTAFLVVAVLLCCSLGGNIYLAWIAWDARSRYRDTAARLRAVAAA